MLKHLRLIFWALVFVGIGAGIICPLASAADTFDPTPWLQDLDQTRVALATKYANLEWVVLERETDLSALFKEAQETIAAASNEVEARAVFDQLARSLGDLHVRFRWTGEPKPSTQSVANCHALGYSAEIQGQLLAALVPGYVPSTEWANNHFQAGIVQVSGHRVGVLKIPIFTPQGMPDLCSYALAALRIDPTTSCDSRCADQIEKWAADRMTIELAAQLRAVQALGAELLLIDVADNGGGTEWAEAAARMVTAVQLKSERMGFVRGPHWSNSLSKKEAELRTATRAAAGDDRVFLADLADKARGLRREADTACESSSLWSGGHLTCSWLGDGLYASGMVDSDVERLHGKKWAPIVFQPAKFNYSKCIWHGPLIVLINGGTGSAAAQFAAVLQDNHAAVIMGSPTVSAGCGHTDGGTPTTLKNSGGVLELPDCARFRADGSNEAMGIEPDVLVGLSPADGPHRRGVRISEKLPEAVALALHMQTASVGSHK